MKTVTRYEVREFNGNEFSKTLGRKLRERASASRIVKILKKQGRDVYASAVKIAA